jgi:hypothetical protein
MIEKIMHFVVLREDIDLDLRNMNGGIVS